MSLIDFYHVNMQIYATSAAVKGPKTDTSQAKGSSEYSVVVYACFFYR